MKKIWEWLHRSAEMFGFKKLPGLILGVPWAMNGLSLKSWIKELVG